MKVSSTVPPRRAAGPRAERRDTGIAWVRWLKSAITGRFDPATQDFRNAPGLGDTAALSIGLLRIEDLADRPYATYVEFRYKAFQEFARTGGCAGIHFQPCIDIRPNEPGPYGALMVCRVTRPQIAVIFRLVIRMPRGKRAQADRCEQSLGHHI